MIDGGALFALVALAIISLACVVESFKLTRESTTILDGLLLVGSMLMFLFWTSAAVALGTLVWLH